MDILRGQKVTLRDVNRHRAQFELPAFVEDLDGAEATFEECVHAWHSAKETGEPTWLCRVSGLKVTRMFGPDSEPETIDLVHCLIPETAITLVNTPPVAGYTEFLDTPGVKPA